VPNPQLEHLLHPWFQVEMQQALDSPDQRLLICIRNKKMLPIATLATIP
jgi:hypothetical protein